jgi:DNA-binding NtrC family response regulator
MSVYSIGVSETAWDCIYLTSSLRFADAVVRLLARAGLRTRTVATLYQARSSIALEPGAALIAESAFLDGDWRDALTMAKESAPGIPVIVLLREFDGATWVQALLSGAYDVLTAPRDFERLPRTVIGALRQRAIPVGDSGAGRPGSWIRRLALFLRNRHRRRAIGVSS